MMTQVIKYHGLWRALSLSVVVTVWVTAPVFGLNRARSVSASSAAPTLTPQTSFVPLNPSAAGALAELRSSAALLPQPAAGEALPTAPAGGVGVGAGLSICDAAQGFAPVIAAESGVADPILAVATAGNIHLPISPTTTPATCGQSAYDGHGNVYVTQAIVDTKVTPSASRGILRVSVDPVTGIVIGVPTYIATTAGLDGNQPTAAAIGPDGNLYVAFLKSGNIKRVVNPGVGTTQVVQSVGNTPNGHSGRALAFAGPDLYVGSIDAFSVIPNAIAPTCQGGCNAIVINDGFPGVVHTGLTSDDVDAVYFSVAGNAGLPGSSQVWRYSASSHLFTFVAQGGADRSGTNASNFSFVAGKTNLLSLDSGGNLWIGDDTSNATVSGAGRLWSVSATALAGLTGGNFVAGTQIQAIFNLLNEPWFVSLINVNTNVTTQFVPTFNNTNLTFTATLQTTSPVGPVTTTSGTWTLTPPDAVQVFANPQAHLTMTDSNGVVLFSNDIILVRVDTFTSDTTGTGSLGAPFGATWIKFAP